MRRNDLIAGLSVAGLMLPEAVAYAGIAGLPPQRAVLAAIAGCLGYALVGRSRFAIVSPTSSSAAILAATIAAIAAHGDARLAAATIVVTFVALFFLLAAALRIGGLAGFISRPVLGGFSFGLAITIIIHQLPLMTGVSVHGSNLLTYCIDLLERSAQWNLVSIAIGLTALVILLLLRRFPAIPGAFLALAGGIVASWLLGLPAKGVQTVGGIDLTLAWPKLPPPQWVDYSTLAQYSLPLVLILFAESWASIRAQALRHGDRISANRELAALGLGNAFSALVQGMPVGAGFSAAAASEAAGAASRATGVVAAVELALLVLFGGPVVAILPEPVLAAVVIAALVHALDPAPLVRLWRLDRDQYVALGAAVGVLALGVLDGMLVAVALSLIALIQRLAKAEAVRLGQLQDGHDYVDIARHPEAVVPPDIAIWRPTAPLFFANADRILGQIAADVLASPRPRAVIVSLEESVDLDSSALDALIEFDRSMHASHIAVQLARAHDEVRDLLAESGDTDLAERSNYSVDDAVTALESILHSELRR